MENIDKTRVKGSYGQVDASVNQTLNVNATLKEGSKNNSEYDEQSLSLLMIVFGTIILGIMLAILGTKFYKQIKKFCRQLCEIQINQA